MSEQKPLIGRIVHYRLSIDDADQVNRRRISPSTIAVRMSSNDPHHVAWPVGAQAHIGNEAKEGDAYPMLIVRVWGDTPTSCVNGQVFLDGSDVLWVTSVAIGEGPRTFSWPVRA